MIHWIGCAGSWRGSSADFFGKNSAKYGKPVSEETRRKMSQAKIGKYNGKNNPNSKLTEQQVLEILDLYYNKKETQVDISKKYNVTNITISVICRGETWKSIYAKFMRENNDK